MSQIYLGSDGKPLSEPAGASSLSKMQSYYGARDSIVAKIPGAFISPTDKRPDSNTPLMITRTGDNRVFRMRARPAAERIVRGSHKPSTAEDEKRFWDENSTALNRARIKKAASELRVVVTSAPAEPDILVPASVELIGKVEDAKKKG